MQVFPSAKVKLLSECQPGQLVRLLTYGHEDVYGVLAHVANESVRLLIRLSDGCEGQFLRLGDKDDPSLLAYDGGLAWEPDRAGRIETRAQTLYETTGAIVCDVDGWFINVRYADPYSRRKMQLNLLTGIASPYQERYNNSVAFGAWHLHLHPADHPFEARILIKKFQTPAEDAR